MTEAKETGEASYLATTVARKDILLAIAGPKEMVPMVKETVTWISTTQQRTSLALMIKPYVVLLVVMLLVRESYLTEPT